MAGWLLEAPLLLWAARRPRDRGIAYALVLEAGALAWAAAAVNPWSLLVGLCVATIATSVACGLAQARLVADHPDQPERILVRWTFMGSLGDVAAPVAFALLARVHGGWRSAFGACAVLCLSHALLLVRLAPGTTARAPLEADAAEQPLMAAVRSALARPALLGWVFATVSCALLDEIFLVFGALYMHESRRFDPATTDVLLFVLALGTVVGIGVCDRVLVRFAPLRMLTVSCLLCVAAFLVWLQVDTPGWSAACLFIVGVAVGPQFPLAQAQCYRASREQPLLVNMLEGLCEPLHAALPLCVGWVAQRAGLTWALLALLAQPLSLLCASWLTRARFKP